MANAVAATLRREKARLISAWKREVLEELPMLHGLSEEALLDHVYEFLDGLAAWVEGRTDDASRAFEALIEGHALQRLGFGVRLEFVTREYSRLRSVLMRELMPLAVDASHHAALRSLDEGIDRAMSEAVRRYSQRREEVRDRFIGILGHDLRDPLSAISLAAEMLANAAELTSEHHRLAERIKRSGHRMELMISDVLDFARSHLGHGIPAEPRPADMGDICRSVAEEFAAARPDAKIEVDISGDLRGAFDRERVAQALSNLFRNGLHFGAGSIELRVWEAEDKDTIFTSVTNRGPAIPSDVRDGLFDAFVGTKSRSGLGLGLFIVQQVALAHGGRCEITSDEQATSFTICWPRAAARLGQPTLGTRA